MYEDAKQLLHHLDQVGRLEIHTYPNKWSTDEKLESLFSRALNQAKTNTGFINMLDEWNPSLARRVRQSM